MRHGCIFFQILVRRRKCTVIIVIKMMKKIIILVFSLLTYEDHRGFVKLKKIREKLGSGWVGQARSKCCVFVLFFVVVEKIE